MKPLKVKFLAEQKATETLRGKFQACFSELQADVLLMALGVDFPLFSSIVLFKKGTLILTSLLEDLDRAEVQNPHRSEVIRPLHQEPSDIAILDCGFV